MAQSVKCSTLDLSSLNLRVVSLSFGAPFFTLHRESASLIVATRSRQEAWEVGKTGAPGAVLSAQNFVFPPPLKAVEPQRTVETGSNGIKCILENLPTTAGWKGTRRQRDQQQEDP